jgi:hypothetical protein
MLSGARCSRSQYCDDPEDDHYLNLDLLGEHRKELLRR